MLEAFRVLSEHPLGIGIGNFASYAKGLSKSSLESSYMQIFVEIGPLFFIFFILFMVYLFRAILNIRNHRLLFGNLLFGIYFMFLFIFLVNEQFLSHIFMVFVLVVLYFTNLKLVYKEKNLIKRIENVKKNCKAK